MTLVQFKAADANAFMQNCLAKLPAGRGVPTFLSEGSSDSVAILAEAALIDLPPMTVFDCSSNQIKTQNFPRGQAPANYVLGMHNGILLNAKGFVSTSDGLVLVESMRDDSLYSNAEYLGANIRDDAYLQSLSALASQATFRPGRWLSLVYALSSNWYHWLIENMGRVPAARAIPDFGSLKIIVSPNLTANQREVLEAVGVQSNQLVEYDGLPWVCEELYLPSFAAIRGSYHPQSIAVLKNSLAQSLKLRGEASLPIASRRINPPRDKSCRSFNCPCPARL